MPDQLEQELRRLVLKFVADVQHMTQHATFRILRSTFDRVLGRMDSTAISGVDGMPPLRRAAPRCTLTVHQLAVVRARLVTLIREQPGQSTAELARAVGIPSGKLRPQLRQLADEGVIRIDTQFSGGLKRHTYRAEAESWPAHHADLPAVAAGASA
jgi:hypothetical protein